MKKLIKEKGAMVSQSINGRSNLMYPMLNMTSNKALTYDL